MKLIIAKQEKKWNQTASSPTQPIIDPFQDSTYPTQLFPNWWTGK